MSLENRAAVSPHHPLCVYAEPLVSDQRVVILGDSSLRLGEQLLAEGARSVHIYDGDSARAERASRNAARGVLVRSMPEGEFDVRDGAFDLAIIPNLASFSDPEALLARIRRLVARGGALLASVSNAPNTKTIEYNEFYDLVALQFEHVTMIGQVPFKGVAIAHLGLGFGEEVSVDSQLVAENQVPEAFIALASQVEIELPSYAIVQVPAVASASEAAPRIPPPASSVTDVDTQKESIKVLELELSRTKARLEQAEARVGEETMRAEKLAGELLRAHDLEAAVDTTSIDVQNRLLDLERQLEAKDSELRAALIVVAEHNARPKTDEREAAHAAEVKTLEEREAAHAAEVKTLEEQLRERGRTIAELTREVDRREQIVKELLRSLEEAKTAPGTLAVSDDEAALRAKLDELSGEIARREAERVADEWKVSELTRKLQEATSHS